MVVTKSESVSSENITSTNEVSIHAVPRFIHSTPKDTTKPQQIGNITIRPVIQMNHHHHHQQQSYSRSSQSTPSPSTTTANIINANDSLENGGQFDPIVKMEVPDDDDNDGGGESGGDDDDGEPMEAKNGNFNYVGEFIAAELNKLPLREAFMLKNILIREVLNFSEKVMMTAVSAALASPEKQ